MAQEYDKIFKENFEILILSFARRMFNIDPSRLEEIPDTTQYTIEKAPDFLKKVHTEEGKSDYILHIEAQSSDPHSMIGRMLWYYGFLYKMYKLPVKQYVLYIGRNKDSNMPVEIYHNDLYFRFHLILVQDINYKLFINSDYPEDVVFAILCNFKGDSSSDVIQTILERLKCLAADELCLRKYLKQLEVLSKLRNLQEQTIKTINNMALTYDLKTDLRYLAGVEKGVRIGEVKGEERKQKEIIVEMIKDNLSIEVIAKYAKVSIDYVVRIVEEMKNEK